MRKYLNVEGIISNLDPAHSYYVRVTDGTRTGPALQVFLPAEVIKTNISDKMADKSSCSHMGKTYKMGAEWYDECISFCTCTEGGKTECLTIECPTDFGLDVLDPHCLDWETVPPNFVPKPPHCCPQVSLGSSETRLSSLYFAESPGSERKSFAMQRQWILYKEYLRQRRSFLRRQRTQTRTIRVYIITRRIAESTMFMIVGSAMQK